MDWAYDAPNAGNLAHSGRVIFAAAGVMVAVFFTFAIPGPLPPKEMGIVLGVAVLLDAALVRLVLLPVILRLARPGPAEGHFLPRLTCPDRRWRERSSALPPAAVPSFHR